MRESPGPFTSEQIDTNHVSCVKVNRLKAARRDNSIFLLLCCCWSCSSSFLLLLHVLVLVLCSRSYSFLPTVKNIP